MFAELVAGLAREGQTASGHLRALYERCVRLPSLLCFCR